MRRGRGLGSVNDLVGHETSLVTIAGMLLQEVGKEEQLEDDEDDEQLDEDDGPERAPQLHVPESVGIKVKDPVEEMMPVHNRVSAVSMV